MISQHYKDLLSKHLEAENAHKLEETSATLSKDYIFDEKVLEKIFQGPIGASEYYKA